MEVVTGHVPGLSHLASLASYCRIWELQGEGQGVAVGATLPHAEALRHHLCAQQEYVCARVYAQVCASDWALEGLGTAGLQGLLLKLSLPRFLGSLSRSRAR